MRFKHIKQQIQEDQDLFEINMSPSNLEKLANQIDARAGMEFEMVVPNVENDEDDFESEPDYNYDESVSNFNDIENFFIGDYNSRRSVQGAISELESDFQEWEDERKQETWDEASYDVIRRYMWETYRDEYMQEAEKSVAEEYPDMDKDSADYKLMVKVVAKDIAKNRVEEAMTDMNDDYDSAYEEWSDDWDDNRDQRIHDWFQDQGLDSMVAVADRTGLDWPHWTEYEGGSGGLDIASVADDFAYAIGKPVDSSTSYHGARRNPGRYVVEPDGSIDTENSGEAGLEFVSPPMPVTEMLSDLDKVKRWAGKMGCYTNDSTGLHINVSVPGYNLNNLDYVKLALLLGDERVLEQFGRLGNTYCKSAMAEVRNRVNQRPEDAAALLEKMKGGLEKVASKVIHTGTTSKYTSINTKDNYVEFRSPGGDWLDANFDNIKNTLLRFVVALDAALDPEKYKEEYYKKLYKVLAPKSKEDLLAYFARYSAGELPKQALKSFVRQAQLERSITKGKQTGKMWWKVSLPGYFASIEVVATSKREAFDAALDTNPEWMRYNINQAEITPLRPYDETSGQQSGPTLGGRPSNPDGNWVILGNRQPAYRFMASGREDAETVWLQWSREHTGNWELQYDPQQSLGQPQAAGRRDINQPSQTDYENRLGWPDQTGDANYEIINRSTGRRQMVFIANTDQDAQRKYGQWLDLNGLPHNTETYGFRAIQGSGQQQQSGQYTYRVYTDTNQTVGTFQSDARRGTTAANIAFRNYLASIGRNSEIGFNYEEIGREQQRPASRRGEWTGAWIIRGPQGREIHRMTGIGNVQADANRHAMAWLRAHPEHLRSEIDVVPEMS